MVNQEFRIDVVVDPGKSKPGVQRVGKDLDFLEKQATELRQELVRALSVREAGTVGELKKLNDTLTRTELQTEIVAGRLRTIGADIETGGIRRAREEVNKTGVALQKVKRIAKQVFAGIGIAFAIKGVVGLADEATNLRNRLRIVSEGNEDLIATQKRLFDISNATRGAFDATVTIYQRLAINQEQLGVTSETLFKFTERLNQAIAISGLTANEARNGIIQLSQGLASGALRGDELRSVLEQLPPVALLISKRLGVTVGELRELGAAGKISSEDIIAALTEADELAEQFASTVPTLGQAFTVLRNNVLEAVGAFDQATGVSGAFAAGMIFVANNVEVLAIAVGTLSSALLINLAGKAIPAAITGLVGLKTATLVAVPAFAAAAGAVVFFSSKINKLKEDLAAIEETQRQVELDSQFAKAGQQISANLRAIARLNRQIKLSKDQGNEVSKSQIAELARLKAGIEAVQGAVKEESDARRAATIAKQASNEATLDVIAGLQQEAALLKLSSAESAIQRDILATVEALKKKKIDLDQEGLEATRAEIVALIRNNAELARQQSAIDRILGPAEKYKQFVMDLEAGLARGAISQDQLNAAVERFKPREQKQKEDPFEKQVKSLREANDQLAIRATFEGEEEAQLLAILALEQQGVEVTEEKRLAVEKVVAQNFGLLQLLKEQSEEERAIAKAKRDQERDEERAGKRIEDLKRQIDVTGQLQEQIEELIALRGQEGVVAEDVDRAVEALRLRQLDASNELAAGFERAFIRIKQEAEDLAQVGEDIVNVFADRATDAIVEFARTGTFSFKEFASAVLDDLIRIIARLLIVQALNAAVGGLGSVVGSVAGSTGATGQGGQHGRQVQPGQAPFPVGEGGEELFVPNRTGVIVPNAADVAQPPPQVNLQVVSVESMDMVPQAISSGIATESIIQELGKNKDRVNQVLA